MYKTTRILTNGTQQTDTSEAPDFSALLRALDSREIRSFIVSLYTNP